MEPVTKQLADFIVSTNLSEIPAKAWEVGKQGILDCLGVALAGSKDPMAEIIMGLLHDMGGPPKAGVWGTKFKTSPAMAALANGTFAHALDFDDWNSTMRGHPTVPVLPAALAIGEEIQSSGKDVLEAYILGFEVEAKLGKGLHPHLFTMGWHPTAVLGVMGAAATAAKLLKLNSQKVCAALGIAASMAAGLRQNFGTMTKPLHAGQSAMNGVIAAKLAERGFTAHEGVIEEQFGYANAFTGRGKFNLEQISSHLGNPFDILSPGLNLKRFPSCARTHTALDAMLELVNQNDIHPGDVQSITCGGSFATPQTLIHSRPRTALEGKFSMEFCLAIALLERKVDLSQFADSKVLDPKVQEMIKKVKFYVRPDLQSPESGPNLSEKVTVILKDGREFSKQVDDAKGNAKNPLTPEDVRDKYRGCAYLLQSEKEMGKTIEMVENLESLRNITSLADALTPS